MAITRNWAAPIFKQLQNKDAILNISFNQSLYASGADDYGYSLWSIRMLTATIRKPSGNSFLFEAELIRNPDFSYKDTSFSVELDEEGEYSIQFVLKHIQDVSGAWPNFYEVKATAYFAVAPEESLSPYTIKDVIDRVLSVTPTRTVNGTNKYRFKNNAKEYATEESPEFTFTGKHLFEVMLDIASYKKMFPALYKDEIYFRPFWNGVMLTSNDLPPPDKAVLCSAIDQYCTALDSYVENMVCVNDTNVGTVVEPYAGGYISTRSNGGSEISETTAIIPTQSGIYQALELKVGETDGVEVGDIQSYVYEQEDYDSLSDTSAAYPYSKAYALKFNRFEKNYTELAHRIDTNSSIAAALTKPALANIIEKATNGAIGNTGMNLKAYLSAFIENDVAAPFADLLFQPTYIPVVNARVRQYKPMYSHEDYESTLYYNQQSEVVDSEAFGEHVKGLIQKLGNHTEIRVYRFDRVDDIPTVGTLIDEKSVYNVAMTIFENHVDTTICLVDYAELSKYIGVKNEIKTSDISTTKWCNRFVNWEEFLVFTHEDIIGNTLSITANVLEDIVAFTTSEPLTCAMFTTYSENEAVITTAFAPIKHLALGNSIYFQWEMLDNFAVGYKSETAPSNATNAITGTKYNRAQRAVRYCDGLGRMEKLDFLLSKEGPNYDNATWSIPKNEINWAVDEETSTLSFSLSKAYPCKIKVFFSGDDHSELSYILDPDDTSTHSVSWNLSAAETSYGGARVYTQTVEAAALAKSYIQRQIAYAYPQKPNELRYEPIPSFQLYDWLIKKDSAEALKFAAQYHFRQDWREFVIGSGMSNFCSLIGGSCSQLQMFISKLPINRFERHVNLGDKKNYRALNEIPTFKVEEIYKRVKITLPDGVNVNDKNFAPKSWGLVGTDKNGNYQLIFGENKKAKDEAFLTTIYLVAMQKNNEPQARATYTLSLADTSNHDRNVFFNVIVGGASYGKSDFFEFPHNTEIQIKNTYTKGIYFVLDGVERWIEPLRSTIFILTKDMEYYVWSPSSEIDGPILK